MLLLNSIDSNDSKKHKKRLPPGKYKYKYHGKIAGPSDGAPILTFKLVADEPVRGAKVTAGQQRFSASSASGKQRSASRALTSLTDRSDITARTGDQAAGSMVEGELPFEGFDGRGETTDGGASTSVIVGAWVGADSPPSCAVLAACEAGQMRLTPS